jgi:hypothetical protein
MKVKVEALLTSDVSVSKLKSGLLTWVQRARFRMMPGNSASWTFERGQHWRSTWTQNPRDVPAELVVRLLSKNPTRLRCSICYGGWLWLFFPEHLFLAMADEFRSLMGSLCEAHTGQFRWVERFEEQVEPPGPFTWLNPMYLRLKVLGPGSPADNETRRRP